MHTIGILNAFGSTVGDDLEHRLIVNLIKNAGFNTAHFWNFNQQVPDLAASCAGLIVGGGGLLWQANPKRDGFFLDCMKAAKRLAGVSLGINSGTPLSKSWAQQVSRMDFLTARDPYTSAWAKTETMTRVIDANSVAWLYDPPKKIEQTNFDLGLVLNHRAWQNIYGSAHPLTLFPGLAGLKMLEIPFAQPVELPFLGAPSNPARDPAIACYWIKKCKVVLTARLHGFILSALCGVPAIPVQDGFKLSGQVALSRYPIIKKVEDLRRLDKARWLKLMSETAEKFKSFDPEPMRSLAKIHEEEIVRWLKNF